MKKKKLFKYSEFINESIMSVVRNSPIKKGIFAIGAILTLADAEAAVKAGQDPKSVRLAIDDDQVRAEFDAQYGINNKSTDKKEIKTVNLDVNTRYKVYHTGDYLLDLKKDRGTEQLNKAVMQKQLNDLDVNKDTEALEAAHNIASNKFMEANTDTFKLDKIVFKGKVIAQNVRVEKVGNNENLVFDFTFEQSDTKRPALSKPIDGKDTYKMLAGKLKKTEKPTSVIQRKVYLLPAFVRNQDKAQFINISKREIPANNPSTNKTREQVVKDIHNIVMNHNKNAEADNKIEGYNNSPNYISWDNNAIWMDSDTIIEIYKNNPELLKFDDETIDSQMKKQGIDHLIKLDAELKIKAREEINN
jgi:hypothetical protein